MTLWILALGVLGLFAAVGFALGAVRNLTFFLGAIVAGLVATPLGGALTGLIKSAGLKNPLWIYLVPSGIAYVLVLILFLALGFGLHFKIMMFYKYKRDDVSNQQWLRMDRRVGTSVGLLTGVIIFFAISKLIYTGGYLTAQVSTEDGNNPAWINFMSSARRDIHETGFDRVLAALDKTPAAFYQGSDILGLLYHNPVLQGRLSNYPYFLSLGQRTEFQEMGADKEYNDLIFGKASVKAIIEHPRTQGILGNAEILNEIIGVDLKDLRTFLETGKSPKYADEQLLGFWSLDKEAVLVHMRKTKPDIKSVELASLRKTIDTMPNITLLATLNNKTHVKSSGGAPPPTAPTVVVQVPPVSQQGDTRVTSRYGPLARGQQRTPPPTTIVVAAPPTPPITQLAGDGEWKRIEASEEYQLVLPNSLGTNLTWSGRVKDNELFITETNKSQLLIFYKTE